MCLCEYNQNLLNSNFWFIQELLEQAGNFDNYNMLAISYYLENYTSRPNYNSQNFIKLWNDEKIHIHLIFNKII